MPPVRSSRALSQRSKVAARWLFDSEPATQRQGSIPSCRVLGASTNAMPHNKRRALDITRSAPGVHAGHQGPSVPGQHSSSSSCACYKPSRPQQRGQSHVLCSSHTRTTRHDVASLGYQRPLAPTKNWQDVAGERAA